MKNVPIKNYLLAVIISLFTIVLVFYIMSRYNNRNVKIDFINEVREADLNYYITENHSIIIYMTSGKKSKTIDEKFKKYLENRDIKNYIIYVNLNEVSNTFKKDFVNKYSMSSNFSINDPTIVLLENKHIKSWQNNIKDFSQIKEFVEGSSIK